MQVSKVNHPITSLFAKLNAAQDAFEAFAVQYYIDLYKELFAIMTAPESYTTLHDEQLLKDCFLAVLKPMQLSYQRENDEQGSRTINPKEEFWIIHEIIQVCYANGQGKGINVCEPYCDFSKSALKRINELGLLSEATGKIIIESYDIIYHVREDVTTAILPERKCFHSNERQDPLINPDVSRAA